MATSLAHQSETTFSGSYIGDDLPLERVLSALALDHHRHFLAQSGEGDLCRLERAIRYPLPAQYRRFLARLGGGIYYDRHEVFGATRLMIHDIELVPDVLEERARLAASGDMDDEPFLLPLHRTHGTRHWLDVRDGSVGGPGASRRFPALAAFLAAVVLPAATSRIPA